MGVEDNKFQIADLSANTTFYDWVVKENTEIIEKLNRMDTYTVAGSTGIRVVLGLTAATGPTAGTAVFSLANEISGVTVTGPLKFTTFIETPDGATHPSLVTSVNGLTGAVTLSGPTGSNGITGPTAETQQPIFISKNKLINGSFDVWQRGETFGGTGEIYFSDMWKRVGTNTTLAKPSAFSIGRQTFTDGQTDVLGDPKYFTRLNLTHSGMTHADDFIGVENRIEGADSFVGEVIAFDGYARFVGLTGATLTAFFKRSLTGGAGQTIENFSTEIFVPGTTFTPFFVKHTVGSTAESGISDDGFVAVGLKLNNTISGTNLDIAKFRLFSTESGTLDSSPYREKTDPIEELAKSSRFYQRSYALDVTDQTSTLIDSTQPDHTAVRFMVDPNDENAYFDFPVEMRSIPSVTVYSPGSGTQTDGYNASADLDMRLTSGTKGYGGSRVHVSGSPTLSVTPRKEGLIIDPLSGFVIFDMIFVHYVADSSL